MSDDEVDDAKQTKAHVAALSGLIEGYLGALGEAAEKTEKGDA